MDQISTVTQKMADRLVTAVSSEVPDWSEIFHDYREDGESGFALYRTVVRQTSERVWAEEPADFLNLQEELIEIRPAAGPDRWYGLSIHIQRGGEVDVKFDYDPDCIESFDDDELNQRPF